MKTTHNSDDDHHQNQIWNNNSTMKYWVHIAPLSSSNPLNFVQSSVSHQKIITVEPHVYTQGWICGLKSDFGANSLKPRWFDLTVIPLAFCRR